MLCVDILTLFPEAFSYLKTSILKRAQEKKIIRVREWNLRDFGLGKRKNVDDRPYGGGAGMVLSVTPIQAALRKIQNPKSKIQKDRAKSESKKQKTKVILLSLGGKRFTQQVARRYSKLDRLILVCGHYEGVDERVKKLIDEEISIGSYALSGGELPAMVVVDAVTRLLPGVLKKHDALEENRMKGDRTSLNSKFKIIDPLFSYPAYTRPEQVMIKRKILRVPKVLLSGDRKKIEQWRRKRAKKIG